MWVQNFSVKEQFQFFGPNLPKTAVFGLKQKKNEPHQWVLDIQIRLCTRFKLKIKNLVFGPDLPKKKGISGLKEKKWAKPLNSGYSN